MSVKNIAGIDLAWIGRKNPTAIAFGEFSSNMITLTRLPELVWGLKGVCQKLAEFSASHQLHGVAIDAPLIIRNPSGQRDCERQIGVHYGSRKAACHTTNRRKYPKAAGVQLSRFLSAKGFQHLGASEQKWQLECYPHPALIEIFGLPERLAYKKGRLAAKRSGQMKLANLLLSLSNSSTLQLKIPSESLYRFDSNRIAELNGKGLKENEDILDAVVCMYVGALYQMGVTDRVFGDRESGYIYVPQSPNALVESQVVESILQERS